MSSSQSRSYTFDSDNGSSQFTTSTSDLKKSYSGRAVGFFQFTGSATYGTAEITGTEAKDTLFPNSVASPTSMDVTASLRTAASTSNKSYIQFVVENNAVITHIPYSQGTSMNYTGLSSVIISSMNKSSSIQYAFTRANNRVGITIDTTTITLYFTRYDFTATAGDNVSSSSVSSSTGYDGDTVTYSCVLASGATFEGWYNGSTLVSINQSYTHTVSGSDLTLTAKATIPIVTKSLSATYNGSQLSGFPVSVQADASVTYNGSTIATVPFSGGTKTLNCSGKVMNGNVTLGGKTLNCSGKVMASNVVATIS